MVHPLAVALMLSGCAKSLAPSTADTDAWALYRDGDLGGAAAAFAAEGHSSVGALVVAYAGDDEPAFRRALHAVDPAKTPRWALSFAARLAAADGAWDDAAPVLDALCGDAADDPSCIWREVLAEGSPRTCASGCDGVDRVPIGLTHDARLPVAVVEVNGVRMPFVLDTGADVDTITPKAAAALGMRGGWRSSGFLRVLSGDVRPFAYAVADRVRLGRAEVDRVPFAVLSDDADYGYGVAGFLNPLAFAGGRPVAIDLQNFAIELGGAPSPGSAAVPLGRSVRKPVVVASVDGRPVRPLVVDTGAFNSAVNANLLELGHARPGAASAQVPEAAFDAAGSSFATRRIKGKVRVDVPGLAAWVDDPLVEPPRQISGLDLQFGAWGRLGADFALGRRIVVDPARRTLWVSPQGFPTNPTHAERALSVRGALFGDPFVYHEELLVDDGPSIVLRARHTWASGRARFSIRVPFTRATLFRWGAPRGVWSCDDQADRISRLDFAQCMALYEPFEGVTREDFRPLDGVVREHDGGVCVDERAFGIIHGYPSTIETTHCYDDPWIVEHVKVTEDTTGRVLVEVDRVPDELTSAR